MRYLLLLLFFCPTILSAQKTPADFGFKHLPFVFKGDTVNILLSTDSSTYDQKKPLFLFVQGSLPMPLCIYNEAGQHYSTFPFDIRFYLKDYHFAIIGKPGVPVVTQIEKLKKNRTYVDPTTNAFPRNYCKNNHLDYYVNRNKAVLAFLGQKDWVDEEQIIVAGHSEGWSIAFKMAIEKANMSNLILLNANPTGRILSIIINERKKEDQTQSPQAEQFFQYWDYLNQLDTFSDDCSVRDSEKATASFSYPYMNHLSEIDLPVFVGYGTKDPSVLLIDLFRLEAIRQEKENFHFKSYFGLEHNFFKVQADGTIDYANDDDFRYDQVAGDFFEWLKK